MTAVATDIVTDVVLKAFDLSDALVACQSVVSRERTLPAFCAVQITATGDTLTFAATDRHRLIEVTVPADVAGADWSVLLDSSDVKRFVAALGKRKPRVIDPPVTLSVSGNVIMLCTLDGELRAPSVDATFPKVSSMWPTGSAPTDVIAFDPAFMVDLCKMPGRGRNGAVQVTFHGPGKPFVAAWTGDGVQYRHLLMSVRIP